jgi:RHS repeat-associated protein
VLPFVAIAASSCAGNQDRPEIKALAKISPTSVSDDGAWALFDRSISSGYTPGAAPVAIRLGHPHLIDVVKVRGPAPYRLQLRGAGGSDLGFEPIDLSTLTAGWHAFPSTAPVRTAQAELVFTPTTKSAGAVPELELWSSEGSDDGPAADLLATNLADRYVSFTSSATTARLAAGECADFPVTIDRPSGVFSRAHLAYHATGAFRAFGVEYSINATASSGAAWLSGDIKTRALADEIDPGTLVAGANNVHMCVPAGASDHVVISDLRIVGELDRGADLVASVHIGVDHRDGAKAIDGQQASSISVSAHEELTLQLDRLIAPDAVLLAGAVPTDSMQAACIDRAGARTPLHATAFDGGQLLDGGASSCAALAIEFDEAAEISELRVLGSGAAERVDWPKFVITSAPEHFGTVAWVGGFTVRPRSESGGITMNVGGEHQVTAIGRFGMLLHRDAQHASSSWSIDVTAQYPDGSHEKRTLELAKNAADELSAAAASSPAATAHENEVKYSLPGKSIVVKASVVKATTIRLGSLIGADVPAGAVSRPTDITVRHLATSTLPPLDAGMINVTAPNGHGYEFLPHGQHFAKPIDAIVPFDPSLIPSTRAADDVRTYYFDTISKHWKPLTRTALDVKDHVVHNATDHFTTMIDAVLAVPTNPTPLSMDPTSLSSIPAASPASGIDVIEAPSASSDGDARLSYPIRVPAGRGAYSPSVALSYSSSGGNGWLGLGWDVHVPQIDIDTMWGVPTYADGEEPRYLLDGAQLVPTTDTDGPTCSNGHRYHTRAEGAFAHIVRCGADPSSYWWEIYDRNGTKFVYGDTPTDNDHASFLSTKPRPGTCTGTCPPGVFRWFLHTVTDTHSNITTYSYSVDDIAAAEPGRDVLPASVGYTTTTATEEPPYKITFLFDGGGRADPIINGRGGFKQQTRQLLRSIQITYGTSIIREYVLTYTVGMFNKSTLTSIQHFGEGGCAGLALGAFSVPTCSGALDQHTFTYVNDGGMLGFGAAKPWGGANNEGGGVNSTYDTTTSAGLSLSDSSGEASVGVNGSWGTRTNTTEFADYNGDGLPDQLIYSAHGLNAGLPPKLGLNQGEIAGGGSGSFLAEDQGGGQPLPAIGYEDHRGWGVDASIGIRADGFGASLSGGFSESTARAKSTVADADGDGYVDFIDASTAKVLLGGPCAPFQCFGEQPFGVLSSVNPGSDPLLSGYNDDIKARAIPAAPVAQWIPPYKGVVSLTATAQLLHDTTGDPQGVTVAMYQGDTQIGSTTLISSATPWTFQNTMMSVTAGVPIYLVVMTGTNDGSTGVPEKVSAFINATYTSAWSNLMNPTPVPLEAGALMPTGASVTAFDMQQDFRVVAARPVLLPSKGTMDFHFTLTKQKSSADFRWCLQEYPSSATSTDEACDSPNVNIFASGLLDQASTSPAVVDLLQRSVGKGDRIVLRAESVRTNTSTGVTESYSIDPATLTFSTHGPGIIYTAACEPGADDSCTPSTDPDLLDEVKPDAASFGVYFAPVSPPMPLGAVPTTHKRDFSEPYTVHDFTNPYGAAVPITIALRSNVRGTEPPQSCTGSTCSYPNITGGFAGEWLSFEIIGDVAPNAFPTTPMYIQIDSSGHIENVPVVYRSRAVTSTPSPFVGWFHNWGYAFWNEHKTFVPDELYETYAHSDDTSTLEAWCDTQSVCQTQCAGLAGDALKSCQRIDLATTALAPVPALNGTHLAGSEPTWKTAGGDAFINTTAMYASDVGGGGFGDDQFPEGGLFESGYLRLSGTRSHFFGAGVSLNFFTLPGGLGGDVGASDTDTTTDLVDVNGDGVLDLVSGDGTWAGHISATAGPQLTGLQFNDHDNPGFRRRTGYDYSISLNDKGVSTRTTSEGEAVSEDIDSNTPGEWPFEDSAGLGLGRTEETQDLVDINGDGLPDVVSRSGTHIIVRYNFGNSLGAPEIFGDVDPTMNGAIDGFQSAETALGLDSTTNALSHETTLTEHDTTTFSLIFFSVTTTTNTASVRTTRMLADINGDGLPDLLKKQSGQPITVQFNTGGNFAPYTTWDEPAWTAGLLPDPQSGFASAFASLLTGSQSVADIDVLAGSTRSFSSSRGGGLSIPIGPVNVGLSLSYQSSYDNYELTLMDVNGDGAPDHVLRKADDPNLYVKTNSVRGRANLLTAVHRPLGGTITLTYADAGNTTDMPHHREVLSRVDVDDGVDMGTSYASPTITTSFSYQNGYYSRLEKKFLGFGTVTTNLAANGGSIVQTYENRDVRNAGHLLNETRKSDVGTTLSVHLIAYGAYNVTDSNGINVMPDPACAANLPDLLQREPIGDPCTPKFVVPYLDETMRYEGGTSKVRTVYTLEFDRFGDVEKSLDSGDQQISTDDTQTVAAYENYISSTQWILGRPTSIALNNSAGTKSLRLRTGTYDHSNGDLASISVATGSSTATMTFGHDAYGNLNHITTPPNSSGEVQTYDITFDAAVHTYPVTVVNGFGDMSSATYDVRYGVATLQTDVSGNSLVHTFDTYGRLASVSGPYDISGPGITMEYHPEASPPSAITVTHPSAPADYTGTLPSAITAVTFVDGLARPIEVRKTSVVDGQVGMTTGGLVSRDALGRAIFTYQPSFVSGASTAFVTPTPTYATLNGYDSLGRTTSVLFPDNSRIDTVFDTGSYSGGPLLFRTTVTDQNGNKRETYTDIVGRARGFTEHPKPTATSLTTYDYSFAGDLVAIIDAEGGRTDLEYDMRGLRTLMKGPDTGIVRDEYDLMGNRIHHTDAVRADEGKTVTYVYKRDRLLNVIYPKKPTVTYKYLEARLVYVSDETGDQSIEYGALGERRRVTRTIKRLDDTTVTFDTHFTTDSLGRQLQINYPDGTTVSNTYDAGGALAQVTASGSGWSKTYADDIKYDVFGNRTHMRFGNNVETSWTYDPRLVRLSGIITTLPNSGPEIQRLVYGYDLAGNPTSIANNVPVLTVQSGMRPGPSTLALTYDGVDQLTNVNASGSVDASTATTYDEEFAYSPSHNIAGKARVHDIGTQEQSATSFKSTYNYASGHAHLPSSIVSTGSFPATLDIKYDLNGNPISRDNSATHVLQELVWDDDNRLSVISTSSYKQTNTYDASGLRALRDENGDETLFANQYFDLAGADGGQEYVFAGSTRIAVVLGKFTSIKKPPPSTTPGTPYYLHPDSLGSTAVVTTDAGDVQESHDYFVDGDLWVDHTSGTPVNGYLFEGKPYDKLTGFYDYGQRFYDPRTSLWLGEDPAFIGSAGKAVGRPMFLAVSAFSGQSPARNIDPDGREIIIRDTTKKKIDRIQGAAQGIVKTDGTITAEPAGDGGCCGRHLVLTQTAEQRKHESRATRDLAELINSPKIIVIDDVDPGDAAPYERKADRMIRDDVFHLNAKSPGDFGYGGAGTINRKPGDTNFFEWWDGHEAHNMDAFIAIDFSTATKQVPGEISPFVDENDSTVMGHELHHAQMGWHPLSERAEQEIGARRYENSFLRAGLGARKLYEPTPKN